MSHEYNNIGYNHVTNNSYVVHWLSLLICEARAAIIVKRKAMSSVHHMISGWVSECGQMDSKNRTCTFPNKWQHIHILFMNIEYTAFSIHICARRAFFRVTWLIPFDRRNKGRRNNVVPKSWCKRKNQATKFQSNFKAYKYKVFHIPISIYRY